MPYTSRDVCYYFLQLCKKGVCCYSHWRLRVSPSAEKDTQKGGDRYPDLALLASINTKIIAPRRYPIHMPHLSHGWTRLSHTQRFSPERLDIIIVGQRSLLDLYNEKLAANDVVVRTKISNFTDMMRRFGFTQAWLNEDPKIDLAQSEIERLAPESWSRDTNVYVTILFAVIYETLSSVGALQDSAQELTVGRPVPQFTTIIPRRKNESEDPRVYELNQYLYPIVADVLKTWPRMLAWLRAYPDKQMRTRLEAEVSPGVKNILILTTTDRHLRARLEEGAATLEMEILRDVSDRHTLAKDIAKIPLASVQIAPSMMQGTEVGGTTTTTFKPLEDEEQESRHILDQTITDPLQQARIMARREARRLSALDPKSNAYRDAIVKWAKATIAVGKANGHNNETIIANSRIPVDNLRTKFIETKEVLRTRLANDDKQMQEAALGALRIAYDAHQKPMIAHNNYMDTLLEEGRSPTRNIAALSPSLTQDKKQGSRQGPPVVAGNLASLSQGNAPPKENATRTFVASALVKDKRRSYETVDQEIEKGLPSGQKGDRLYAWASAWVDDGRRQNPPLTDMQLEQAAREEINTRQSALAQLERTNPQPVNEIRSASKSLQQFRDLLRVVRSILQKEVVVRVQRTNEFNQHIYMQALQDVKGGKRTEKYANEKLRTWATTWVAGSRHPAIGIRGDEQILYDIQGNIDHLTPKVSNLERYQKEQYDRERLEEARTELASFTSLLAVVKSILYSKDKVVFRTPDPINIAQHPPKHASAWFLAQWSGEAPEPRRSALTEYKLKEGRTKGGKHDNDRDLALDEAFRAWARAKEGALASAAKGKSLGEVSAEALDLQITWLQNLERAYNIDTHTHGPAVRQFIELANRQFHVHARLNDAIKELLSSR